MRQLIIVSISVLLLLGCKRVDDMKLEKIIFHTSGCFGHCPIFHSEIDSAKGFRLFSEYVDETPDIHTELYSNPDSSRIGYFTGNVSDLLYKRLENELQIVGLGDLKFDGVDCCDGSVVTIIVYYNGKKKFFKSMFPPKEASKLVSILRQITESTTVERTSETFEIENEKTSK